MTTKNCANGPKLVLKDLCEKAFVRNVLYSPNLMTCVKEDQDEIWHAEVWQVNHDQKLLKGYFFAKRLHWDRDQLWVRESSSWAMDIISDKGIINIFLRVWHSANWQEQIWQCDGSYEFCKFLASSILMADISLTWYLMK